MKIVREGIIPPKYYEYQFECKKCYSVIQAKKDELEYIGSQYNEGYYKFICPFCKNEDTTSEFEMKKVGVYDWTNG